MMKYVIRIVALPFFAGIVLVHLFVLYLSYLVNFVRFGGEFIAYTNKNQRKCINDIYLELVSSRKSVNTIAGFEIYEYAGTYVHYNPVSKGVIIEAQLSDITKGMIINEFNKALISGEVTKYKNNDKI